MMLCFIKQLSSLCPKDKSMLLQLYPRHRLPMFSYLYSEPKEIQTGDAIFDKLQGSIKNRTKESKKFVRVNFASLKVDETLKALRNSTGAIGIETWVKVERDFKNSEKHLLTSFWPTPLLASLCHSDIEFDRKIHIANSLKLFMKSNCLKETMLTTSIHMATLAQAGFCVKEKEIIDCYHSFCETYDLFEPISADYIMESLSQTTYWKECYTILKKIEIIGSVKMSLYNHVIVGAVLNEDMEHLWKLLKFYKESHHQPSTHALSFILRRCSYEELKKLMLVLAENDWIVSKETAIEIAEKIKDKYVLSYLA